MDTLNLAGVKTTGIAPISTEEYLAHAETQREAPKECPFCHHDKLWAFGSRNIRYQDLRLHGNKTLINLSRQRFRCQKCLKTFFPEHKEFDPEFRLTTRCVKWIEQEAIHKPFTHIADYIGIDEKVVRNVFGRYAHKREEGLKPLAGRVIGIDELYLLSQHRCIITNLESKTVIDLLKERKYPTVTAYLKRLQGADKTEVVCIDMWDPYRRAVNTALPKAQIVVDKFHVTKLANECLDRIRKQYQATLAVGTRRDMMRSRFILMRRSRDLTPEMQQKLDVWKVTSPELADAYEWKEKFFDIYNHRDPKEAKKAYDDWANSLPLSVNRAFRPLRTAMENWHKEVFTYFDSRFTNAYTECLNGIAKVTNRTGRGYSFDVIRFKLLFAHDKRKLAKPSTRAWLRNMGIPFSTFNEDWPQILE